MLGRTDSRRRLWFVLFVFVVVGGALVARLGYWQISERARLVDSVRRQISVVTEIPARRGTIYDRSGTVVLAESVTRDRLIVSADRMDAAGRDQMGYQQIQSTRPQTLGYGLTDSPVGLAGFMLQRRSS